MSRNIDIFIDFRSPYSYLATPEIPALSRDFNVNTRLRFGLPLAIRKADFFRPDNERAAAYILLDWERRAEMLGLPHAWPTPDPIVQSLETLEIAAGVFRLIFGGTKNWHEGDHLAQLARSVGLDFEVMEKSIENADTYDREIEANHLGHL